MSVPKPVNLPSVLKETGTSVSARGAFNSTRTWGGAGAGAGGDGGRTSGTAAGETRARGARWRWRARRGAGWTGRARSGRRVTEAARFACSRAKEGEDGGTARGESRRRSATEEGETRSVEYPSLGDDRRANGFGIASDVVEQVRRYMDDDGRAVRRARREDEDERSVGRTPPVETERRGASAEAEVGDRGVLTCPHVACSREGDPSSEDERNQRGRESAEKRFGEERRRRVCRRRHI